MFQYDIKVLKFTMALLHDFSQTLQKSLEEIPLFPKLPHWGDNLGNINNKRFRTLIRY